MIQVFKTDEEYVKWLDGQRLPSGIVVYVSDDETMYFSTNNIKGELKTYKCEKEEPIQYPPLIYSTNAAGSTITVNGETVTLGQGDNMVLEYPTAITSVKATNNTALTYIQIPNTVTSINDNAFTGCTALTDFNFNGTMEQWGAITLGNGWKDNAAFTVVHCTDGDVTLEEPIQPIQPNKLVYSTNAAGSKLTVNGQSVTLEQGDNITLDYPNEITSVKATNNTELTAIQIPNTVTSIGEDAFLGCSSLVSVNIPESVKSIGNGAFYSCSSLVSVNIPESVKTIDDYAFNKCTALASVTLPNSLSSIGHSAFSYCKSLVSITIPEGVTSINSVTFNQCYALASVTLPNSLISIDKQAFSYCSSLVSITIPEGVTSIGQNAFSDCTALASVTLPNTLVSIGKSAFFNCAALASVTLPNSLSSIGDSAFNSCESLLSITIPNSVTSIDGYALANCSKLTDFNYNGTTAQWASITLGTDWKYNTPFTVVHCSDGDVTV